MTTPSKLLEQMQLSEASYAAFDGMPYQDEVRLKERLRENGFSNAQADEFVRHWQVVGYQGNTSSGFSATLFEGLNPDGSGNGQLTLALRGTETGWLRIPGFPNPTDLALTDVSDIVLDGLALDQIVDMFNYVQRLKASPGSTYTVARLENYNALTDALRQAYVDGYGPNLEAQYSAQGYIVDRPTLTVRRVAFTLSDAADGLGKIAPGQTITVTGHSLGGHLAMAFTRLFDNATAYTANAVGFAHNANVTNLFAALGGQNNFDTGRIWNLYGTAGPNYVTADETFGLWQAGTRIPLFTESIKNAFGHGIRQMTDTAAVYDLFFQMDSTLRTQPLPQSVATVTDILKSACGSGKADFSVEAALNCLLKVLVPGSSALRWVDQDKRQAEYAAVDAVRAAVTTPGLGLLSLAGKTARRDPDTFTAGPDGLAVRYALKDLEPVRRAGVDYGRFNPAGPAGRVEPGHGSGGPHAGMDRGPGGVFGQRRMRVFAADATSGPTAARL